MLGHEGPCGQRLGIMHCILQVAQSRQQQSSIEGYMVVVPNFQ